MTERGVFTRFRAYNFSDDDRFQMGLDKLRQRHEEDNDDDLWLLKSKLFYYNKFIEAISVIDYLKEVDKEDEATPRSEVIASLQEDLSDCHLKAECTIEEETRPASVVTDSNSAGITSTCLPKLCPSNIKENLREVGVSRDLTFDPKLGSVNYSSSSEQEADRHHHNLSAVTNNSEITDVVKKQMNPALDAESKVVHLDTSATDVQGASQEQEEHQLETKLTFSQIIEYLGRGEEIPGLKQLDIKPTNLQPTESVITKKAKPWEDTIIQ